MFPHFPELYNDELLYSVFARYHVRVNSSCRDTLTELHGHHTSSPTLEFPTKIKYLVDNLPKNMGFITEDLIQNYSLYPLYAPFLPENQKNAIKKSMEVGDGRGIKAQIGFLAGGIAKKDELMYCPLCAQEDVNEHDEAYFHRVHQVQGVSICHIHRCYLKEYPVRRKHLSRLSYIICSIEELSTEPIFLNNKGDEVLVDVAKGVQFVLDNELEEFNQLNIHDRYMTLLGKRGFLTVNRHIKQNKLCNAVQSYFGQTLLNQLESNYNPADEYNWVKVITRKPMRVVHPIRHILFMLFLGETAQSFFSKIEDKSSIKTAFPCLNYVSDHYKQSVVTKYKVTPDYKSREAVGTFYCDCGFIYSRKMNDDIFKVGTIKNFGYMWEAKLKEVIASEVGSLRAVARMMGSDPGTVKKYANKLGLKPSWNVIASSVDVQGEKIQKPDMQQRKGICVEGLKKYVEENPTFSRTLVRKELYKEYAWLYRHDKILLESLLPRRVNTVEMENRRIDWELRDNEMCNQVFATALSLVAREKPTRVTRTRIGRELGIQSFLEKSLGKLPKTSSFLDMVTESIEEFQMRRIWFIAEKYIVCCYPLLEWELYKKAGLDNKCSERVRNQIKYAIERLRTL